MDDGELQFKPRNYEKRIVSYFDLLGWRESIIEAGENPRRIGRLAAAQLLFSQRVLEIAERVAAAHVTSFSDNVVVSVPYEKDRIIWSVQGLATIQLSLALMGFWARGAITIGPLLHDEQCVFGPALNRAYELESKCAEYPRILLDPDQVELHGLQADFLFLESGDLFTDPFTLEFMKRIISNHEPNEELIARFNEFAGGKIQDASWAKRIPADIFLYATLQRLKAEMAAATQIRQWEKLAWLFNRIAPRVGVAERAERSVAQS